MPIPIKLYGLAELEAMPTLSTTGLADKKVDDDSVQIWVSREDAHDSRMFERQIDVYENIDGRWLLAISYNGELAR